MTSIITDALFKTEALKVCPENQPFWYTSGLFGPYYINTHFLFGSETEAKMLLQFIEKMAEKQNRHLLCKEIAILCKAQYEKSEIYRSVIDSAVNAVKDLDFEWISGGERRDYFFSIEIARQLNKPHLTLFKDNQAWLSETITQEADRIDVNRDANPVFVNPKTTLHIADLITEASSYTRNWIDSVRCSGGKITDTLAIVDRCQGGIEVLAELEIKAKTLVQISPDLFADALGKGLITKAQQELLLSYYADPHQFVRDFLEKNPEFLAEQAALDSKTSERVERLKEMKL